MSIKTINDLVFALSDYAGQPIKFATGPDSEVEIALIYEADGIVWIDLEPPLDG